MNRMDALRSGYARFRACMVLLGLWLMIGATQAAGTTCAPLTLPPVSAFDFGGGSVASGFAIYSVQTPAVGGVDPDFFDFEFYGAAVTAIGTFNLGTGIDSNYATCERCLLLCMDVDQNTFTCGKRFLQVRAP